MPKVSIIIPFNNVERYISACLESVLNQTLKDIEVILVNDCSTDKSRHIAEKYMEKDSRIKLMDIKERKGQGYARNRAIEIAQGEYIGFVDSDDFIEPDMFELLYNSAKTNDTDISMCQVREYDDINEKYITSDYYSLADLSSFGENVFSAEDTKDQILDINVALWNKVYKREYLNRIGEKFPEGYIYEDLPFFFGTYLPAKRIQIVWKNLYSYRVNRKNSTMQQFNNKILDRLPMVSLTYEKLKSAPYLSDMKQKIQGWIINDLFHRYTLLKEKYHKEFFFLMKKVFESLEIEDIEDPYWSKVYHFQGYLLVINNSFEDFNQKVFNEYLDIHKVEDRLRSEMLNTEEIDRRFNLLYQDLDKNYKYTEELADRANTETQTVKTELQRFQDSSVNDKNELFTAISDKAVSITQETDIKISGVYDEISKNYRYTEDLFAQAKCENESAKTEITELIEKNNADAVNQIQDLSSKVDNTRESINKAKEELQARVSQTSDFVMQETDLKISRVYDEISKSYKYSEQLNSNVLETIESKASEITGAADEKIKLINDEITKNYEYTEELTQNLKNNLEAQHKETSQNLYNDIKDLSFVVQDNFVELINNSVQKNNELSAVLRNEFRRYINNKMNEFSQLLNQAETEINNYVENIKNDIQSEAAVEKQNNQTALEALKSEFAAILQAQQQKHEEEVINLKNQILKLEADLREEMKSPLKKFIEKYQSKQEH